MQIAHEIIRNLAKDQASAFITLDYEARQLRRKRLETDSGEAFFVELPETVRLQAGDGFVLENGSFIAVLAGQEALLKITHNHLPRMAWHIGNRHIACEIHADCLIIRQDAVLERMLKQLGCTIEPIQAPFNPEMGAYHSHHHDAHS